jgi:hypothetical protein
MRFTQGIIQRNITAIQRYEGLSFKLAHAKLKRYIKRGMIVDTMRDSLYMERIKKELEGY